MPTTNIFDYTIVKVEPTVKADQVHTVAALFQPSVTVPRGSLMGELTASPGVYVPYDHTAVDGRQVLKGLNPYDITTDANGYITNAGGPMATQKLNSPVYTSGDYNCADVANITELDDAIAAGYCKLIQGTATTGIFRLL